MADSRAQGYLAPLDPLLDDDSLLDAFQKVVRGITGIEGDLVRPRWQPDDVPNMPDYNVDWCALRVARTRGETFHYEDHVDCVDQGSAVMDLQERRGLDDHHIGELTGSLEHGTGSTYQLRAVLHERTKRQHRNILDTRRLELCPDLIGIDGADVIDFVTGRGPGTDLPRTSHDHPLASFGKGGAKIGHNLRS